MCRRRALDLSFIVPVRGDAPFLSEAVASAFEVSPSRTEVILVIDGPTSSSGPDIDRLLSTYTDIKVLSQKLSGAGAARNQGLSVAQGDFVSFLDADDVVVSATMRRLLRAARHHDSDVVCGLLECFRDGRRWMPFSWRALKAVSAINSSCVEHPEALRHNSACGTVYRRAFLRSSEVVFPTDVHRGEDWEFSLSVMRHTKRLTVLPEVAYLYRKYHRSFYTPSSKPCPKLLGDLLVVHERLNTLYRDFETPRMRLTRDMHFTESIVTHLKRLAKDGSPPSAVLPVLSRLSATVSTMVPAVLDERSRCERLGLELIRVGALLGGFAFFGSRSLPAIQQLQAFPEVSLDPRALVAAKEFARWNAWTPRALLASVRYLRERVRPLTEYLSCFLPGIRSKALIARLSGHFGANDSGAWLIGERGGYLGYDTSFCFFRWMRTHHPSQPCYMVVEASEIGGVPLELRPWVVRRGTWENYRRLYRSRVLIFNFSGVDLCRDWRLLGKLGRLPKASLRVFLNHGITAIHKVNGYWHREQMALRHDYSDIFCVSSSREREFLVNDLKHPEGNVVVTGLPRLDDVCRKTSSAPQRRRILYIPTWRPWLRYGTDTAFTGSRFFAEVAMLLDSRALHTFLKQEDGEIILLGHHVFKPFMDHLKALSGDRATVLDMNSQNTQAVLASADVLITDYSSASFDCAYIGVPVLYFQFDQEHFYHNRGGYYVEPRRELPGRVITTQEQLMAELQSVAERNWQPEPQFSARLKDFFDHRDDRNCARLFDVIQERLVMVTNCTAGGKTSGPQCC